MSPVPYPQLEKLCHFCKYKPSGTRLCNQKLNSDAPLSQICAAPRLSSSQVLLIMSVCPRVSANELSCWLRRARLDPQQIISPITSVHLKCHSASERTHEPSSLVLRACVSAEHCRRWREHDYFHRFMGEAGGRRSLPTEPQVVCGEAICRPFQAGILQQYGTVWGWRRRDRQHPTLLMTLFYFYFTAAQSPNTSYHGGFEQTLERQEKRRHAVQ